MREITPVVKQLLIINIIFFVGALVLNERAYDMLALYYFESDKFRFWQPLTHMFMHGSIAHIAFNMFALYSFGSALEHYWGAKRFLFFYIVCGLGAALIHTGVNYYLFHDGLKSLTEAGYLKIDIINILSQGKIDTRWTEILGQSTLDSFGGTFAPAVGASGAIYGLLIAFAFMFPDAQLAMYFIPVPIKAKYFVPIIVGLDLFSGVTGYTIFGGGNIAHFAHVGGALFGLLLMLYWRNNKFKQNRWN
jgi:membrane associated rhomboid family serine protease